MKKCLKFKKDTSQTGEFDKDEAVLVMYLAFFNEDSIYNIKAVHKKVNAMGEKLKNLNNKVENLETKIRMIEVESHQTKIILRNIPLSKPKEKQEPLSWCSFYLLSRLFSLILLLGQFSND